MSIEQRPHQVEAQHSSENATTAQIKNYFRQRKNQYIERHSKLLGVSPGLEMVQTLPIQVRVGLAVASVIRQLSVSSTREATRLQKNIDNFSNIESHLKNGNFQPALQQLEYDLNVVINQDVIGQYGRKNTQLIEEIRFIKLYAPEVQHLISLYISSNT